MAAKQLPGRLAAPLKRALEALAGRLATWLLRAIRRVDPDRLATFSAGLMRRLGPWLPEHRIGRANLAAAYPDKPADEIEKILGGVWDNLGRVAAEYVHLDRLRVFDPARPGPFDIEYDPDSFERFHRLRTDGKPALVFTAHLANWELPALAAAAYALESAMLYRAPSIGPVAAAVRDVRSAKMGTLIPHGIGAPSAIAAALERGVHIGILVDQWFHQGIEVVFFGRSCRANPIIARFARHFDCPIHGTRVIRLPGRRFRIELTEALTPPRDSDGLVDVQATTQMITDIIESWVRECPEQWLWLHRRWR